jgi:Uncharacterized protein conserved in bacteria (DUF2147)
MVPTLYTLLRTMSRRAASGSAVAFTLWVLSMPGARAAGNFEGDWNVPGEKPGSVEIVITVLRTDTGYRGVLKSFPGKPHGKPDDVCTKCPPPKKGLPLQGLEVLWGLKPEGEALVDGYFMIPDDGQIVRCQMRLSADGKTLHLKIYAGLPVFGSTLDLVR